MSEFPVRCESCGAMSRVPTMAVGMMAICPECRREFLVQSIARDVPTVYPSERTPPSNGLLFGLAVSAFLIPLAWLLAKALGAPAPVFTLGLPLSIAIAATGLGISIALVNDWSFGLRVKLLFGVLAAAWMIAALFYLTKAEWVESIRRDLGLQSGPWFVFKQTKAGYSVEMPGRPRAEDVELIHGWSLEAFRFADRQNQSFAYVIGSCRPEVAKTTDDKFFAEAKDGAATAAKGTLIAESKVLLRGKPGREFVFKLADQATNRTVRVYRNGERAVVAMAEGAFLPPDARDVKHFFNSLDLPNSQP